MEKDRLFKAIRTRVDASVEGVFSDVLKAFNASGDIAWDESIEYDNAIDTITKILAGMVMTNRMDKTSIEDEE